MEGQPARLLLRAADRATGHAAGRTRHGRVAPSIPRPEAGRVTGTSRPRGGGGGNQMVPFSMSLLRGLFCMLLTRPLEKKSVSDDFHSSFSLLLVFFRLFIRVLSLVAYLSSV